MKTIIKYADFSSKEEIEVNSLQDILDLVKHEGDIIITSNSTNDLLDILVYNDYIE
jgi:hypothetical protein